MAEVVTKAGRYQIVRELGRGSMGVVYQGYDPVIGRTVAIKTMLSAGLSPEEFEEYKLRFQREAQAAGVLAHPNIITVYDFGEDNGLLYLAMEYLEGKSLEKIVQEQTVLPLETILPIFDQICSALDHAHENHIIHRDIKPANIMILQNGLVKVTDFGIAKVTAMGLTQVGQVLGTPNYMSPEQVKGRQIDGRSDIFSLGVILYELVTGEKPFGGQNITTVIYKIVNENPIPPRELDASIPVGLSYVITKALAKKVDDRYQTCRELADDLKNYRSLGGTVAGQETVVLKAYPDPAEATETAPPPLVQPPPPPSPPSPAAPVGVSDAPIASSFRVDEIAPAPPRRQSIPQIAWVLGAFVVLAILGVLSYFFVLRPGSKHQAPPPVVQAPATPVATVGQLVVSANVNGARISVDDKTNPSWLTPYTIPDLAAGTHSITISKSGYNDYKQSVAVEAGKSAEVVGDLSRVQITTTAPPAAKAGELTVSANVTGAKVSIDDRSEANWLTPVTIPDISAGVHNVVISMDGYDSFQQSATIAAGQTTNVVGTLSPPTAELDIITVPKGLEVIIDGKSYGPSPVSAVLPLGNHTYAVKGRGAAPGARAIKLTPGIHQITVTLGEAVATGVVVVRTVPPGATVLADGAPASGQTPTSLRLSVGAHQLAISLSGCQPAQRQVAVSQDATINVDIPLSCQ